MKKQQNKIPKVRFPEFEGEWLNEQLGQHIKKTDKKNKKNLILPVYSINNKEGFLPQSEQFDGVSSNDRGFDISIYKIIQPNTFAYNPARINVGSIGYSYNLANILISSLYVCFQTDDKIDDSFLLAFLDTNHFKTSVLRFQEGGVRQYLFFDNLSKIKLPFPTLPEQQKIAHFFSIVDKKLTQLQEKKTALELYKKGMMQQIFSQQIRFKEDNGQDFPEWEVKKLGEVTTYTKGFAFKSSNYSDSGSRIVRVSDLGSDKVKSVGNKIFINESRSKEFIKYKLSKGDIIITTVGSNPELRDSSVGRGILVKEDNLGYLNQNLLKFNVNFKFNNDFIYGYINTDKYFHYIKSIKRGNANQANITVVDLLDYKIQLPNLKEQTKIANFLSKIDAKINTVTEKIEQIKVYKKGMLQQMFV